MTTPPKPSPEAVAAARAIKAQSRYIVETDVSAEAIARVIDNDFAPIIAKAELCDRLAALLQNHEWGGTIEESSTPCCPECGFTQRKGHHSVCQIKHALADYTRAAGPADAGGGRENL